MKCCVLSCKNYSDRRSDAMDGITFHLFASEDNLRQQWITKINRQDWSPTKYTKICSCHFNDEDFIVTKKDLRKLKKGTLPCLKLDISNLGNNVIEEQNDLETKHKETSGICIRCMNKLDPSETAILFEDREKALIAKVYHFLLEEYIKLNNIYDSIDLTPLSKCIQRTAEAFGVNESDVAKVLEEEQQKHDIRDEEPPEKRQKCDQGGRGKASKLKRKRKEDTRASSSKQIVEDSDTQTSSNAKRRGKDKENEEALSSKQIVGDGDTEGTWNVKLPELQTEDYTETLVVKTEATDDEDDDEPSMYTVHTHVDADTSIDNIKTEPLGEETEVEPPHDVDTMVSDPLKIERPDGEAFKTEDSTTDDKTLHENSRDTIPEEESLLQVKMEAEEGIS